ncbi:TPA: HPr(Ser) kinase/phosphatase [Candidatus Poribacteria bacterium]|nr:HPr(Ser) kinase/phosphatase [Candidatus Poribacteria bacterium]
MPQNITVEKLLRRMEYELQIKLIAGEKGLTRKIRVAEINLPGLALCGYYKFFAYERIQILGNKEIAYLNELEQFQRDKIIKKLLSYQLPCIVVARNLKPPDELIAESNRVGISLLSTNLPTPVFIRRLLLFLEDEFGPYEIIHGNFVEVFGIGVLILGESGIGKSECALELIKRGHRLVADDSILLKHISGHRIYGMSSHVLKHYMEVRGLGIIDVLTLFGITAIRSRKRVELVVTLEHWDQSKAYDRSGLDEDFYELLGEKLPHVVIPVRPGRNISIIVEVAAMNLRAKKMGYHAAEEFNAALIKEMQRTEPAELEIDEWEDELGI